MGMITSGPNMKTSKTIETMDSSCPLSVKSACRTIEYNAMNMLCNTRCKYMEFTNNNHQEHEHFNFNPLPLPTPCPYLPPPPSSSLSTFPPFSPLSLFRTHIFSNYPNCQYITYFACNFHHSSFT